MIITIIIVVVSLIILMALHELGHFLAAKKCGVRVEEFGIGYPPRIFGKKIKGTLYSLNWLPFGAFVKILGEDKRINDPKSFSKKPIIQRAFILAAGVISFWFIAFLILTFTFTFFRVPTSIENQSGENFINPRVIVSDLTTDASAHQAGIKLGDEIVALESPAEKIDNIIEIEQIGDFVSQYLGQEIIVYVKKQSGEVLPIQVTPQELSVEIEGQGLIEYIGIGVALARVGDVRYAWYEAPGRAAIVVFSKTIEMPRELARIIWQKIKGEEIVGLEIKGIVGIGQIMGNALNQGIGNYFTLVAILAIWLAIANLFPIPALDGGRLLFLAIEAIKGKPVSEKIETKITAFFFILLIGIMALVTIKDIVGLF